MYNINEHILRSTINAFGGTSRKVTVYLDDGCMYMLKLPEVNRETGCPISYFNNTFSEYLGCKIFKSTRIPVQDVILGEYHRLSSKGDHKKYIGCLCKNIATDGYILSPMENAVLSSRRGREITAVPGFGSLDAISECISEIDSKDIRKFYSDMFVVDAFLGTIDRNNGNWGILVSPEETILAPVYDCGACLCPELSDAEMSSHRAAMEALHGTSALIENGNRIEYRSYLMSGQNPDVNNSLKRIVPRINMGEIADLIKRTSYLSQTRVEYYIDFLTIKYEQVLVPALENILEKEKNTASSRRR